MIYIKLGIQIYMTKKVLDLDKKKILLIWPRDGYDGATLPLCYIYLIPMLRKHYDVKLLDCALHEIHPESKKFTQEIKLKREADFIIVDIHGEITSEKMAMGYFFDGKATMVVGTHTHVPTSDHRILEKGTAYQTDIGMCGDYNSVIGMNRDNSLKKFFKDSSAKKHYPALGEATLSGLIVKASDDTGLAKEIEPIIIGGVLKGFK